MDTRFQHRKFWQDVRASRRSRGWSQAQVGKEFGVGGSAYGKWERNKLRQDPIKLILDIAFLFDFNIYDYYIVDVDPDLKQPRLIEDETVQHWPQDFAYEAPTNEYGEIVDQNGLTYAEWRANNAALGMPVAEDWQND